MRWASLARRFEHSMGEPKEPEWPEVEFIVSTPAFPVGNKIGNELQDAYVDDLFRLHEGRIPAFADFACYRFEKSRSCITNRMAKRAGLLVILLLLATRFLANDR